jgi:hypothetical protein
MTCVTTVSYKIGVNGDYTDSILLTRGLGQGDPLSPYLFILCAEEFLALMENAEREGCTDGVKGVWRSPEDKSHVLHRSEYIKNQMLTELSIVQIVQNDKYLGLLVFIGKSKKRAFEYIKRKYGLGYKASRKNSSRQGRKYLSRLLHKPSPPILCHVLT